MKNNLISIIVPIYNAEKYIEKLLISINNQKYDNYEVILVNDGSTDKTKYICEKYIINHKKMRLINKKNTGVSDTRNLGIKQAKGKYLCFIDADDILTDDYLSSFVEIISNKVEKDNSLICCQYEKMYNNYVPSTSNDSLLILKKYTKKEKYNVLYDNEYSGYLWNKMFLKRIIKENKIEFRKDIYMSEDLCFIFDYLKYVDNVLCINKKNYIYRIINSSASKNILNKKWFSVYKVIDYMLKNNNLYTKKLYRRISYAYQYYLFIGKGRVKIIKNNKINCDDIEKEIKNRIKNSKKYFKVLSIKQKIKILVYKYFGYIILKRK